MAVPILRFVDPANTATIRKDISTLVRLEGLEFGAPEADQRRVVVPLELSAASAAALATLWRDVQREVERCSTLEWRPDGSSSSVFFDSLVTEAERRFAPEDRRSTLRALYDWQMGDRWNHLRAELELVARPYARGPEETVVNALDFANGPELSASFVIAAADAKGDVPAPLRVEMVMATLPNRLRAVFARATLDADGDGTVDHQLLYEGEDATQMSGASVQAGDPVDTISNSGNLLTRNQASLETDTTGWAVRANATIARTTAQAADGAASLQVTAAADGTMAVETTRGASGIPVTGGKTYTVLASLRAAATSRDVLVGINWFDASGADLGFSTPPTTPDATGSWTQVSRTEEAPAAARFASVVVQINSPVAAEVHYVDKVSIASGSSTTWALPDLGFTRLTPATSEPATGFLWSVASDVADKVGRFALYAKIRDQGTSGSVFMYARLRFPSNAESIKGEQISYVADTDHDAGASWEFVYLGTFAVPTGIASYEWELNLWRSSGSSGIDVDYLAVVPVDEDSAGIMDFYSDANITGEATNKTLFADFEKRRAGWGTLATMRSPGILRGALSLKPGVVNRIFGQIANGCTHAAVNDDPPAIIRDGVVSVTMKYSPLYSFIR